MPRSLQAQMTRRAISPRLAMRIFLNGPDAKESFSVFDRLAVLNELGFDDAWDVGLNLIHELHGFDDAEDFARDDVFADGDEGRSIGGGRFVKSTDDGGFDVEEGGLGFGRRGGIGLEDGGGRGGRGGTAGEGARNRGGGRGHQDSI